MTDIVLKLFLRNIIPNSSKDGFWENKAWMHIPPYFISEYRTDLINRGII
jgi:hypothetical protein